MSEITNKQLNIATMSQVVVEKTKLLSVLKENKQKHDEIYNLSVSGYWDTVKERLDEKKVEFSKAIKVAAKSFEKALEEAYEKANEKDNVPSYLAVTWPYQPHLNLTYPVSHGDEYNRAIRLVELSVYDKVELSLGEFDKYVMNNWEWKGAFLASNVGYAARMTTGNCIGSVITSGLHFKTLNSVF
jgi:hypothetical protein